MTTVAVTAVVTNPLQLDAARAKAKQAAESKLRPGFKALLLHESGVPDIRIVLEGGRVAAVFYRNSNPPPSITVTDLDYAEDLDQEGDEVLNVLEREGYDHIPFLLDDSHPSSMDSA